MITFELARGGKVAYRVEDIRCIITHKKDADYSYIYIKKHWTGKLVKGSVSLLVKKLDAM